MAAGDPLQELPLSSTAAHTPPSIALTPPAAAPYGDSDERHDRKTIPPLRSRIDAVDVLRGVIMVLMALDHVRDYFGNAAISPTNLAATTAPLFFTRWITHFCAPVFFLLTGTGAYLARRRRSTRDLSIFLLTRGIWLIFLELVVFRCLIVQFNFDYHTTILTVLWSLGWAMIVLAALVHARPAVVTAFGLVMIAAHNLLDPISANTFGALAPVWSALHSPNIIFSHGDHMVFAAYPLIPWVGVTAVGYGLGQVYAWDATQRRRFLTRVASCARSSSWRCARSICTATRHAGHIRALRCSRCSRSSTPPSTRRRSSSCS